MAVPVASRDFHIIRHQEWRFLWPAEILLRQGHLVLAKRRTMHLRCTGLIRAAVPDNSPNHDQRWVFCISPRFMDGCFDCSQVVSVFHAQHLPAIGLKPSGHVFGKGHGGAAIQGDQVVVVQVYQFS